MKVLLIHPPPLNKDMFHFDIVHPPLGIAYIAAFIRNKYDVSILDANALNLSVNDIKKRVIDLKPDVVGITSTTANIFNAFAVAKTVKKVNKDIVIILGGVHATASPEHALSDPNIDYICVGEGEHTTADFLDAIQSKSNEAISRVKGIAYKNDKKIVYNERRELIKDLDSLPMPAYDLLPMDKYQSIQASEDRVMTLITSRGCPYQCIFCDVQAVFGRSYRFHSPKRTIEEIKHLMKNYGITEFHFKDSEFTLLPKRVMDICDQIVKNKLKIKWLCNGRVNHMSLLLLQKMHKAGCKMVTFGVESGDDRILKILKKAYTTQDVMNAFKLAKKAGIETTANMIIGSPGDTRESIERTIEFAKEIDADYASFNFLIPFPNTELHRMAVKNKWLLSNYRLDRIKYDSCIMNATELPLDELNKYVRKAYLSFYLRPKYILKRAKKLHWHEIKTNFKGLKKLIEEFVY